MGCSEAQNQECLSKMAAAMWQNCSRKCKGLRKGRLALLNGAGAWPQCVSQSPKLAALWVMLFIWLLYMLCFAGSAKPRCVSGLTLG